MSTELKFKRPGGVEISIQRSQGKRVYVYITQMVGRRSTRLCKTLVSIQSVSPADCTLWHIEDVWTFDIRDTSVLIKADEARQLIEAFDFNVRRIEPKSPAAPEAQPCHA